MMDNSTTFQGDGKVAYIPIVVNGKQAKSKCFSCKNKNVKTSYGYTTCNYSGFECRNFELYDPIKKTNGDNFRAMTDEELAEFIENPNGKPWYRCGECKWESCKECCLDWLKQEVE